MGRYLGAVQGSLRYRSKALHSASACGVNAIFAALVLARKLRGDIIEHKTTPFGLAARARASNRSAAVPKPATAISVAVNYCRVIVCKAC